MVNGSAPVQQSISVPIHGASLPMLPLVAEPIGTPSECLLLKNMFDPATEVFLISWRFSFTDMHDTYVFVPSCLQARICDCVGYVVVFESIDNIIFQKCWAGGSRV